MDLTEAAELCHLVGFENAWRGVDLRSFYLEAFLWRDGPQP